MRSLWLAPLMLATVAAGAGGDNTDAYALAWSTAEFAEIACPGARADDAALALLKRAAGLDGDESASMRTALARDWRILSAGYEAKGAAAWCDGAIAMFGPKGEVAPGLIVAR